MGARLIVSLTSYPPRFATLHLTLRCLLRQTLQPDAVQIWITESDMDALPENVRALSNHGLDIIPTQDIRSYKKIIPALEREPDAFIATADDDAYYPATWLETLVSGLDLKRKILSCGRAHRVRPGRLGAAAPYARWSHCVAEGEASASVFPTGVGGVLYPPGSLDPLVTDKIYFRGWAPDCDDAWLYWMTRRSGWRSRKVGAERNVLCWPGTQRVGLQHPNARPTGNDAVIKRLTYAFGCPWRQDYDAAHAYDNEYLQLHGLAHDA